MRADQTAQDIPSVETALNTFAEAHAMEQKASGLRELMKGGVIHSVRNDPRFAEGVKEAVDEIRSPDDSKEKLFALALIARVASRVTAKRAELDREIESALRTSPPRFSLLSDADDRTYAAQALRRGSGDWVAPYVAQAIVEEETGEKARHELVRILLEKTIDLAGAFHSLGEAFIEWVPKTEAPGDSAGRRLKRVLAAVRREILLTEKVPGDVVGESVDRLVYTAFRNSGAPISPKLSVGVAVEVVMLVHDLVRTRFSLATDGVTYKVVRRLSRWFAGGAWPNSLRAPLKLLSRDIEEAVTLLAKQGVSDNGLLDALATVEGSREGALRITGRIATNTNGLSRELTLWLRRGRVTRKGRGSGLLAESNRLNTDPALAQLLIDSRRLAQMLDGPGQDLLNDVRIFSPDYERSASVLMRKAKALAQGVKALAGMRNLRVRGEPGEVVDYSPIEHEGAGTALAGERRVRIVSPLIERIGGDGVADIVIKAVVEPTKTLSRRLEREEGHG